jgi:hypothetical protein
MLENFPTLQSCVSGYLAAIQHQLSIIGRIRADPAQIPFLKIEHFDLTINNDGVKIKMPFKLEPLYFLTLGPIGMMKLLKTVFNSVLSNIPLAPLTAPEAVRIAHARIELALISDALINLVLQVPDSSAYLIRNNSELNPIVIQLEIKFNLHLAGWIWAPS